MYTHIHIHVYDGDNRVCTRGIKHGEVTVEKTWSGEEN